MVSSPTAAFPSGIKRAETRHSTLVASGSNFLGEAQRGGPRVKTKFASGTFQGVAARVASALARPRRSSFTDESRVGVGREARSYVLAGAAPPVV